jgi:hypothetical protein
MERLGNELVDLNCAFNVANFTSEANFDLAYLVGPFYGWGGTNQKCEVLVGTDLEEIFACAVKGSQPTATKTDRYIYRIFANGGTDLPVQRGQCEITNAGAFTGTINFTVGADTYNDTAARAYGQDDSCYTQSMIDDGSTGARCDALDLSGDATKCSELQASD